MEVYHETRTVRKPGLTDLGFFASSDLCELHSPRCAECELFRTCTSPRMPPTGEGNKSILVVAEAPGEVEDKRNTQLVGKAGQHLRQILQFSGIDLDRDCRKINAVNCRPPNNRTPKDNEIACCRGMILKEIHSFKPKTIVLLGLAAVKSVIGPLYKDTTALGALSIWVDRRIPCHKYCTWLLPTYHPSYLLRKDNDPLLKWSVLQAFLKARAVYESPAWRPELPVQDVSVITDPVVFRNAIQSLHRTESRRMVSFDYETSGLKPDKEGHFIRSMSLSDGIRTYSGLVTEELYPNIRAFLKSTVRKCCHNMKFEIRWSQAIFGVFPSNLSWDSMLAQHWLDNRKGTCALKFQTFARWGIPDYSTSIQQYTESNGREFNRIGDAPVSELLQYGGMDALLTRRLAVLQKKEVLEMASKKTTMPWEDKFQKIQEWTTSREDYDFSE